MVHEAVRAELPILVSVGTEPGSGSVVPFISEAHGNAAAIEGPQFLNEPVLEFLLPFAGEEFDDGWPALNELGAVSPPAIDRIGERDLFRIAGVPAIFGEAHFFGSASAREGWQRRVTFGCVHRMFFLMVSVAFIRTWSNAADEPMRSSGVSSVHRQRDTHHEVHNLRPVLFIERRFFLLGEGRDDTVDGQPIGK
jgi:hypothetical protein